MNPKFKHSEVDIIHLPHFKDEETEIQRGEVHCSRSSSELVVEPRVHLPLEPAFLITLLPPREPLWAY